MSDEDGDELFECEQFERGDVTGFLVSKQSVESGELLTSLTSRPLRHSFQ